MKNVLEGIRILKKTHPDAKIALTFKGNWQLLVVVVLSAQCTDVRVNIVSPPLFKRFPDVKGFAECEIGELEKLIYSTGFYRNKAKNIKATAERVVADFGGKVPDTMEELLTLPGVARKTANVILNNGFGKSVGIVVDTHVLRVSGRLGWVEEKLWKKKNAVKVEQELMKVVPKKDWGQISQLLIWHGRKICKAPKPLCCDCPLNKICPSNTCKL